MDKNKKWNHLEKLALQDDLFQFYSQAYNESAVKYSKIIRWCPPKLRSILNQYADSGRLMMQRMAGIALENMEFKNKQ